MIYLLSDELNCVSRQARLKACTNVEYSLIASIYVKKRRPDGVFFYFP
jgi:hypothetical protein